MTPGLAPPSPQSVPAPLQHAPLVPASYEALWEYALVSALVSLVLMVVVVVVVLRRRVP